jgi:hypothetical protein
MFTRSKPLSRKEPDAYPLRYGNPSPLTIASTSTTAAAPSPKPESPPAPPSSTLSVALNPPVNSNSFSCLLQDMPKPCIKDGLSHICDKPKSIKCGKNIDFAIRKRLIEAAKQASAIANQANSIRTNSLTSASIAAQMDTIKNIKATANSLSSFINTLVVDKELRGGKRKHTQRRKMNKRKTQRRR